MAVQEETVISEEGNCAKNSEQNTKLTSSRHDRQFEVTFLALFELVCDTHPVLTSFSSLQLQRKNLCKSSGLLKIGFV